MDSTHANSINDSNTTFNYVNSVLEDYQLNCLTIVLSIVSLLGFASNILVVFLTKGESCYNGPLKSKRQQALTYYFIFNLAFSYLLSSLISSPALLVFQYIHPLHTNLCCKIFKGIQYAFPALSNQILAILCLDRYLNLAYPFSDTANKCPRIRRSVKATWISALLWAGLMSYSFHAKRVYFLNSKVYTTDCVQDFENRLTKGLYLSGLFFTFLIPLFIISYTTVRSVWIIARYQRGSSLTQLAESKIKATWLAIWLVIIFAIMYLPFIIYQAVKLVTGQHLYHQRDDSLFRYSFSILVFFNGVINPIMYFANLRRLRQKLKTILGIQLVRNNAVGVTTIGNVTYKETTVITNVHTDPLVLASQGNSLTPKSIQNADTSTNNNELKVTALPGFLQLNSYDICIGVNQCNM